MEIYFHAHGLKKYCQNVYATQSNLQNQCNPCQNSSGIFHRNLTNSLKIFMEPQKSLSGQNNLEKEQS